MKKMTIISGPSESGKTYKAREMADGKRTVFLDGKIFSMTSAYPFKEVEINTEVIIIDDVPPRKMSYLMELLLNDQIAIPRKGDMPALIDRPEIIISVLSEKPFSKPFGFSYKERFTFLHLDPRRKRRYNLCHRLRMKGIEVDVEQHTVQLSGEDHYNTLPAGTRKYIDQLVQEYRYIIQFQIGEPVPLKFKRRRDGSN